MRDTFIYILCALVAGLLVACQESSPAPDDSSPGKPSVDLQTSQATAKTEMTPAEANPPAEGFNASGSEARAIAIADSVVWAYGGRKSYDENRYFSWNFFGARDLLWDKTDQLVRIDFPSKNAIYLLDYSDMSGRVQLDGTELTEPEALNEALKEANSIWINDSYWLVHQFKLKDSGVTLKYVDSTPVDPEVARPSYVIDQTFAEVGDTPGNRYRLYIDQETYKINSWQFFKEASDEEAAITTPWKGEVELNGVTLSADRGGRFQLGNISAPTKVEEARFTDF